MFKQNTTPLPTLSCMPAQPSDNLSLMGYYVSQRIITEYGQMVGFMAELVLLSIALADKIKRSRLAKEEAQKQTLNLHNIIQEAKEEKLRAQEQLLEMERRTNEELEQKVAGPHP